MGKVYKQGIASPKGFNLTAGEPSDQRDIVEFYTDLASLTNTYLGIEVKVQEETYKKYKLIALPSNILANWTASEAIQGPVGPAGPQGAAGPEGPEGAVGQTGPQGAAGSNGVGVPTAGNKGQALVKVDQTDYNTEWATIELAKATNYREANSLNRDYTEANIRSQIIADLNDGVQGGIHASIYIEDQNKWFVFSRTTSPDVFIFEDLDDLSTYTKIDVSIAGYEGVENASFNPTTGKIYFTLSDREYSQTNTIVRQIDVSTNVVSTIINYNTGVVPGSAICASVGNYIYTMEGNYGFKINRFTTGGTFVDSVASGTSVVIAHSISYNPTHLFVGSYVSYNEVYQVVKVKLSDMSTTLQNITIAGGDTGGGSSGFTNQSTLVGQYLYMGTENFTTNYIVRVNINDMTDYDLIDVLKGSDSDNIYMVKEFQDKLYYGGTNDLFGIYDLNTNENYLLENPFPYSLNEMTVTNDIILLAGFDVYPVSGTGYVGVGKYFNRIGGGVTGAPIRLDWLPSESNGDYTIQMGGRDYMHNYTPGFDITGTNYWLANTFIGANSGNFTMMHSSGYDSSYNTGIGSETLASLTTGNSNVALGNEALALLTTGTQNIAVGAASMYEATTTIDNMAIGGGALQHTLDGNANTAIGTNAGRWFGGSTSNKMTSGTNSIYIGGAAYASSANPTNEIVFGHHAVGGGDNTATIGNSSITKISAGADFVATADADLITKGYFDSNSGDVTKVGTPANNELAVWTGDGTLEGDSNLTLSPTLLTRTGSSRLLGVTDLGGSANYVQANGRTLSAYTTGDVLANLDMIAVSTYFNSNFLLEGSKFISTANGNTTDLEITTDDITKGIHTDRYIHADGEVTGSNLSGTNTGDNAVNTLYSGLVSNATHTGDVTGDTTLTIADDAVDLVHLSATGSPSASNFLRGDYTWATPAGSGNVSTSGTPVANDFARFTGATDIEGRSYSEVRTDLGLVIGTDVQAYSADLDNVSGTNSGDQTSIVGITGTTAQFNTALTDGSFATGGGTATGTNTGDNASNTNYANDYRAANFVSGTDYEPAKGVDDNFVTDAEKTVIGNTSGTNTGDNAVNTLYSGLVSNVTTNLGYTASSTNGIVTSSDGTNATLPLADGTDAGLLAPGDFTKLGNTTGTNSGDQTSIVGITGTTAEFNTALSDGSFATGGGTATGTNTGDQTITLTGDVTGSGTGSFATTIANDAVDIAMLSATGTASATTYLRGDNTWTTITAGDVTKVGTPVDNQVAVWTGDGTVEGHTGLTYNGTHLLMPNASTTGYVQFGTEGIVGMNSGTMSVGGLSTSQDVLISAGSVTGVLTLSGSEVETTTDPSTGDGIGNRDYNDARYAPINPTLRTVSGTTDTLVLTDDSKYIRCTSASATTVTVPPNSSVAFATGTQIHIRQAGAGQVTIAQGSGVTVNTEETLLLRGQHATITLIKVGTDEWDIMGSLEVA